MNKRVTFVLQRTVAQGSCESKIQSSLDNSNLQGKSKKGSSYREFEESSRE